MLRNFSKSDQSILDDIIWRPIIRNHYDSKYLRENSTGVDGLVSFSVRTYVDAMMTKLQSRVYIETPLLCNVDYHWLDASLESVLHMEPAFERSTVWMHCHYAHFTSTSIPIVNSLESCITGFHFRTAAVASGLNNRIISIQLPGCLVRAIQLVGVFQKAKTTKKTHVMLWRRIK